MMRCLRNVVQVLLHEHPGSCQTVWSAHAATYCWFCGRSVTDDPVPGYALVNRGSGQILQGRRGGIPTPAFFTSLAEAEETRSRLGLERCEVQSASATPKGIQLTDNLRTLLADLLPIVELLDKKQPEVKGPLQVTWWTDGDLRSLIQTLATETRTDVRWDDLDRPREELITELRALGRLLADCEVKPVEYAGLDSEQEEP